ncbi:UDP-2,3-diacetamido-2,3-dideoxy-D-glucuronate 2-epimerase [compost metagenome]
MDHPEHLHEIMKSLNMVAAAYGKRLICSIHPRTSSRIASDLKLQMHPLVEFHEPFGFFDFVKLERHTLCALTDSGTVQEECCIIHVPTVTLRKTTERPETVDCGSNIVSGLNAERIAASVRLMTELNREWECPKGYLADNVAATVVKFLCGGKRHV